MPQTIEALMATERMTRPQIFFVIT
jgi:hypothetical protein